MAFVNPSINSKNTVLTEEEKKDIFDRLTKIEQDIINIQKKSDIANNEQKNEISQNIKADNVNLNSELPEYTELDMKVTAATVTGKPAVLNIPVNKKIENTDFNSEKQTDEVDLRQSTIEKNDGEYKLINPNLYVNKTFMTSSTQRFSLFNVEQRKHIDEVNNKMFADSSNSKTNNNNNVESDILSIDNIMKIS